LFTLTEEVEKPKAVIGFSSHNKKDAQQAIPLKKTRIKTEINNTRIRVSLSKPETIETTPLRYKYNIAKYDLHPGYIFPEEVRILIPKNTPEYVDRGEKYVERIVRALYHFKQCALIGPSGTGKTHIVYLVAELCGLPIWEVNCGLQASTYDLFGRYIGLGKENWVDGQIIMWCRT